MIALIDAVPQISGYSKHGACSSEGRVEKQHAADNGGSILNVAGADFKPREPADADLQIFLP